MNVCLVKHIEISLTETFIRAHVDRLPADVSVVHRQPPVLDEAPLRSNSLPSRAFRLLKYKLGISEDRDQLEKAYLRAFRRVQPDIVLAEYGIAGVRVRRACRKADVPLVVHFHGYDAAEKAILDEYRGAYRDFFRDATMVVVSNPMREQLISMGAPPERVFLNPYGIDCDEFEQSAPEESAPVFLAVGRFVEKKAPHLTILAFHKLLEACPEARLRMIGDGPLLDACSDLVKGLNLSSSVTLLGSQPHGVVKDEMQRARAFVQHSVIPSSGDSEGTPVAILEAGASGLPVVSTRHAGIPDAVVHGETGYLVEERDVEAMAEYMIRLAREPGRCKTLGRNARRRIETYFEMNRSIGRLSQVLRWAAGKHNDPPSQVPMWLQS